MKHSIQKPGLPGFKYQTLAIAVATAIPLLSAHAEVVQTLPTTKADTTSEDSYKVDKSTSIKYSKPLLDTAQTISVIPQSEMKDRGVTSLRQALRTVPGISFAAGEGGAPTGDSMSIRGFSARNNIMIDGVRDVSGYYRDMYNVEAVEVAKGPSSTIYGRGTAGGAVNLQTKKAGLETFTELGLTLGSESDYRAQVDSNVTVGESSALRVNVLADDGEVAGRDEVENSNKALALTFGTGLGTDSRLHLSAEYQKQENLPDYGIPWVGNNSGNDERESAAWLAPYEGKAPPVDFDNFYGNVYRDFEDIEAQSVTLEYEKDLSSITTLRTLARYATVERQSIVTAPRFPDDGNSPIRVIGVPEGAVRTNDEKTRDTKNSQAVVQVDLLTELHTGEIQHEVITGVEVSQEKFERWNYEAVVADNLDDPTSYNDLYNPNPYLGFSGRYDRGLKSNEATGDTKAIYVFDTLTFNPQWLLSVGLRYDIFETEYFPQLDDDTDPKLKVEGKEKELSWNFGLVYKPAENGSIYFGAGTSFSPSAEGLTVSTRSNASELKPEELMSYELGTKWELLNSRLLASAAIFRTEKTHAQTSADADTSDLTLKGRQRVDGLELSAVGHISPQFMVTAAYTYQSSEVVNAEGGDIAEEGAELANTPEHALSVWGHYDFTDRLNAGVGALYVDERYNNSDPGSRETAEDFWTFDMMVGYNVTAEWRLQLNGTNLTDEDYADQLGGGHFVPGEGRYFSLSTWYTF